MKTHLDYITDVLDKESKGIIYTKTYENAINRLVDTLKFALGALSSISLAQSDTTSTRWEKLDSVSRSARETAEEIRTVLENFDAQGTLKIIETELRLAKCMYDAATKTDNRFKTALEQISKVRYGVTLDDTSEEALKYWSNMALEYRQIARNALDQE